MFHLITQAWCWNVNVECHFKQPFKSSEYHMWKSGRKNCTRKHSVCPNLKDPVSTPPWMHPVLLCTPKNKKKMEDMINKGSSVQSRTRLGIASSDLKRHEGSSFTVVSLWPVRLQAYASISINQSIPGCANFQMAEAPIWIQCGIGRVQHDCLIKSNRERTPKNQTGHIDFVNTYHSMILFE